MWSKNPAITAIPWAIGMVGLFIIALFYFIPPAESTPRFNFKVTEWTDKHGRQCTAITSNTAGFGSRAISVDCD